MKKQIINALAFAVILGGGSACDTSWGKEQTPEAVKEKLTELFPAVENAEWDDEQGNYEAEFEISGRERTAVFTAGGELIMLTEEIEEQYLPEQVLHVLQEQYASHKIEEAHRIQQNGESSYSIELEKDDDEFILNFSESGKLLGQQQEAAVANTASDRTILVNSISRQSIDKEATETQWELPTELREVSSIAMLQGEIIACVQDEEGAVYLYNLKTKAVDRKIEFAGPGDYEGISVVGNTAYVLRSDGAIYEIANFKSDSRKVTLHKSNLADTQDTEGLAYDKANNRLLIACKGFDKSLGDNKAIYAFSLADKKMTAQPVVKISLAQEQLTAKSKKGNKYAFLQPSSIEKHPVTGEIYLLDAENHLILIINEQGQVHKLANLDKKQLPQPEGLTFSNKGEMYIASEGSKKGKGVIIKYPEGL
ncbi:SdiA-regulated domain-containing protein [Pontibacter silvestris]|uniref:SdiA-regulated domain-containing protein n=1 Tax=Pontibacter silvestris TaxID=2305183 RepID=A0ABW4X1J9_9BACT|nr:SdiA-regulated domain-containing protein [Pontibacter silvestris]MCC9135978.1 SdiA-regulated domain-containing protein [Pontibacter silvestris]